MKRGRPPASGAVHRVQVTLRGDLVQKFKEHVQRNPDLSESALLAVALRHYLAK
jgi:metal-responsive CopG/Arc/MetJ family transcriptional regulator